MRRTGICGTDMSGGIITEAIGDLQRRSHAGYPVPAAFGSIIGGYGSRIALRAPGAIANTSPLTA